MKNPLKESTTYHTNKYGKLVMLFVVLPQVFHCHTITATAVFYRFSSINLHMESEFILPDSNNGVKEKSGHLNWGQYFMGELQ